MSGDPADLPPLRCRIGCSGWDYPHWRGSFYDAHAPRRRWLELYAERFTTVEVNSTFYRLARPDAVKRWLDSTPASFRFALKASRYLTHVRRLSDLDSGIKRFYEPLEPLIAARRLGPVLWQLPATFHRDDRRLREWIEALPPGRHAIEFRDASWFVAPVLEQLRRASVAVVLGDHPSRPFQTHDATAPWRFIRFHHGHDGASGDYSARELDEWAARIDQWRRTTEVWAYFNNDWEAFAPADATALAQRLENVFAG